MPDFQRLKIVSNGKASGTRVFDPATGRSIPASRIEWVLDVSGERACRLTIDPAFLDVELEADAPEVVRGGRCR
jgi:hypothetical protein